MQGRRGSGGTARRTRPARAGRARPGADLLAALAYLALLSLFGGGLVDWNLPTILLLLATIVFAVFVAARDGFAALAGVPPTGRVALAGIAALPLLQLVPLPPAIWQALPGQELRRATLDLAGIGGSWQPATLEPFSTAICAVLAVGFVAFVDLLLRLSEAAFRQVLAATFALVILGLAVGLLQVVSDGHPDFFGGQPGVGGMGATLLGFFANKNHMALAIACSILLFGLVLGRGAPAGRRRLAVIGFTLFALVCIVATNSRAGLGLGMLAAAAVLAGATRPIALRWRLAGLAAVALLGAAVASSPVFETVLGRVGEVGDDLRWQFTVWSLPLARRYLLPGSGVGTFKTLFQTHEQLAWLIPTYVNAVHDDYLQLVIEAGLPGVAILVLLAVSLAGPARRGPPGPERLFGLAAVVLFALHSTLDYPLRRPAAWAIFAVALACVYRQPSSRLSSWSGGAMSGRAEAA